MLCRDSREVWKTVKRAARDTYRQGYGSQDAETLNQICTMLASCNLLYSALREMPSFRAACDLLPLQSRSASRIACSSSVLSGVITGCSIFSRFSRFRSRNSSGSSWSVIRRPRARTTARSITFLSWRTLPGQENSLKLSSTSSDRIRTFFSRRQKGSTNSAARSAMSFARSRRGGTSIWTTLMR